MSKYHIFFCYWSRFFCYFKIIVNWLWLPIHTGARR